MTTLFTTIAGQGMNRPSTPGRRRWRFIAASRSSGRFSGWARAANRSETGRPITTSQTSRLLKKVVFFSVNRGLKGMARSRA